MLQKISESLWQRRQKILFAFFLLAIFFRIFSILAVPEPTYNDAVYHLKLAQQIIDGGGITREMPPFLYHLMLAGFFGLTGLPMQWPFVKVIPLAIMLLQICIAFVLFRKIFPENFLVPTLFFTAFPWGVRIGSVNMIEGFATLSVVLFAYFLYKLSVSSKEKERLKFSFFTAGSFLLMGFTKANVILLMPFLLAGFFYVSVKKIGFKKSFGLSFLAAFLGSLFILISINAPVSPSGILGGDAPAIHAIPLPRLDLIGPAFLPASFATFFDFPPLSSFEKIPVFKYLPFEAMLFIFILMVLPMGWLILRGVLESINGKLAVKEGQKKRFFLVMAVIFMVSFYPALTIIRQDSLYVRYLLPVLPFCAILLGIGFNQSGEKIKKIAIISLLLFSVYSFAMTSTSAVFYQSIQEKNAPLYSFISNSTEVGSVISMHNSRALSYYTNKEVIQLGMGNYVVDDLIERYSETKYVAITCYNEDILTSIPDIISSEKTDVVFEQGCAKLIKINSQA